MAQTTALIASRVRVAVRTMPGLRVWLRDLLPLSLLLNGVLLATGIPSGLVRWQPIKDARSWGWAAAYVLLRSVVEELIFRAAMLPHTEADHKYLGPVAFAWESLLPGLLFVLSHTMTTQRTPKQVLSDGRFLFICTVLTLATTGVYYQTGGSYWAVVFTHWALVYPFVTLLGGWRKTHTPTTMSKRAARPDLSPAPLTEDDSTKVQ